MGFFIQALLKTSTLTIFRFLRCMENLLQIYKQFYIKV